MLKLKQTNIDESISIKDMRVGQVGIITEWDSEIRFIGELVKRMERGLASLSNDSYWSEEVFKIVDVEKLRVKILPNGTELVITNNE